MAKNYAIITAVLIIGILASGAACTPLNKPKKTTDDELSSIDLKNIRSGTEGLKMEFVKNVPPDQVYANDDLTIMVDLINRGAENIEDPMFYIGGFDRSIVPFETEGIPLSETDAVQEYIPGKDELRGEEGETAISFTTKINGLPTGTDVYEPYIILTACYGYKTIANPVVCIDPNPFGVYTASKACQPRTVTEMGGQGAPIAVTKVEQIPSRGKVQFKIYIENKAKGKAIADEKVSTCNLIEPTDYKYINKIDSYEVEASGLNLVACQPDPENLRLVDDKGVIICSFDTDQSVPAYTTPLKIELDYNYMESTQPKKIRIIKI